MSAAELPVLGPAPAGDPAGSPAGAYGTIVVVGGGCYGSYYVRQLGRSRRAGRIAYEQLLVVDRDAQCAVAVGARDAAGAAAGARVGLWRTRRPRARPACWSPRSPTATAR